MLVESLQSTLHRLPVSGLKVDLLSLCQLLIQTHQNMNDLLHQKEEREAFVQTLNQLSQTIEQLHKVMEQEIHFLNQYKELLHTYSILVTQQQSINIQAIQESI